MAKYDNLGYVGWYIFNQLIKMIEFTNERHNMKEMRKMKEKKKPKRGMDKKDDMKKMVEKKIKKDCP